MERLTVNGFAGIEDVTLDVGQITLIIGPQASGKSICTKLLYYFKSFISEISRTVVSSSETKRDLDRRMIAKFERFFPSSAWPKTDFSIKYQIGKSYMIIRRAKTKKASVELEYSDVYARLYRDNRQHYRRLVERDESRKTTSQYDQSAHYESQEHYTSQVSQRIGKIASYNQIFIPAGRSFFALLQSSIFSFLSNNDALDPFLVDFGVFYERVKSYPRNLFRLQKPEITKNFDILTQKILQGRYGRDAKGRDILIMDDGRTVSLENSSSGQQEILPLTVMLPYFANISFIGGGATVYIEEPEAHLFPTAQKHIVELIASALNMRSGAMQYVITTHSPYILTAFNNLLQAGKLAQKSSILHRKLDSIIPRLYQIPPCLIRPYALRNGLIEDLLCKETGLISSDIIDEVSNSLSVEFGSLLEVE